MAELPVFKNLDEAVEFWESHDSIEYMGELEEASFDVDLHQNLLHPNLIILAYCPNYCPRCRHKLHNITIEYLTWSKGRLLVIKDIPALICKTNSHEYILEDTLNQIEHLLEIESTQNLQPTETIQVPVLSFEVLK